MVGKNCRTDGLFISYFKRRSKFQLILYDYITVFVRSTDF